MSYFNKLPNELKTVIYLFDPTYKNKYNTCIIDINNYNKNMSITESSVRTNRDWYFIREWIRKNSYISDISDYEVMYGCGVGIDHTLYPSFAKYTFNQIKRKKNRFTAYLDALPEPRPPPWLGYNYPGQYTTNHYR